jgi:hypothetical protein
MSPTSLRGAGVSGAVREVLTVVGIRKLLLVGAEDISAATQAEDIRYFA